jgi:hypothetical protein
LIYEATRKKGGNETVIEGKSGVLTNNILARKSQKGAQPYYG